MNAKKRLLGVSGAVLLGVGAASAAVIGYDFETPVNISGSTSNMVYTAPDSNTFGDGIAVSSLELSDDFTPGSDYGRIVDLGGGSVEAAVNDRAGNTISFTVLLDDTVTVDLSSIAFDTSFRFTLTGDSTVGWDFYTIVGGVTNNMTSSDGWTHDGVDNYQSPGGAASGDIALTGLTGLRDTEVTFVWNLDSSRNNTFATAAMGLDDVVLTGAVVQRLPRLINDFSTDIDALATTGTVVTLSWDVAPENLAALSILPTIGNVLPATVNGIGQTSVVVNAGTTFTIMASNDVQAVSKEVVIAELQPEIPSFAADDYYVSTNASVVLSWDVSSANSVSLSGMGSVSSSNSVTVHPSETTTYALTASNAFGVAQKEVTVAVGPARPNIILMLVDDWGVTDLSVPFAYDHYNDSGKPIITKLNLLHKTPNLERLAARGMKFTQAYATPKCSSTRATLMTGYHPARHGITFHLSADSSIGNGPNDWRYNGFDETDVTLAHLLGPAHYRTVHLGKWHLGGPGDYAQYPTACGFDINIGGSNAGSPGNYIANATTGFAASGKPAPNLEQYIGTGMYITKALTIELNRIMGEAVDDGVPFFAYMSYYGVHDPETWNPDAVGDYSDAINLDHRKFCTMVEAIDVSCSNIVAHLEELGIAEETLIIHLGDNGSENPVHQNNQASIPEAPFDDFPMRGMKNDGYQGGSRVPLMISWARPNPDNPMQQSLPITAGSVEHDIVGIEDIAPTILSVAGVEQPFMDGYDLGPYLRGEVGAHRPQKYLLYYPNGSFPNGQLNWYREGDWKLMYGYEADQFLLFNLAYDPTESTNCAAANPDRVVQMARAMAAELDSKWGDYLGTIWPVVAGTYPPRPGTDDPFVIPYDVEGRDTVDSDGDGLADALEDADWNGLLSAAETDADASDTDGDGSDDYTELRLDLDPRNAAEAFTASVAAAGGSSFRLTWPSVAGTTYNILLGTNLLDAVGNWQVAVSNIPAHAVSNETSRVVDEAVDVGFFRLELLPE
ncbi:sulfatase-like hydrolase/transferase [Pontiella sp.]|uniref:sulfatase-like hydrolase/transferase n=1 Tax=Pontiella sp. TaxID=2837462 RepID=UPI003569CD69